MKTSSLYRQVVSVTREYLGPAADRFVSRQVENHLHMPPEELDKNDLKRLIVWMKLAMNLMVADTEIVEEYLRRLNELIQP